MMLNQQGTPLLLQLPFLPIFGLKPGSCRQDTLGSARNLASLPCVQKGSNAAALAAAIRDTDQALLQAY